MAESYIPDEFAPLHALAGASDEELFDERFQICVGNEGHIVITAAIVIISAIDRKSVV